jgi:hypothetical protein
MSITSFLSKTCVQTAVYWGSPTNDGYGGKTFAAPIEIFCRWEDRNEIFIAANGDEAVSKSVVYVLLDLENEGYLYLGTLDELYDSAESSGVTLDPSEIVGAQIIKRFDKTPALNSTTEFIRKAYLTSKNMV